MDRSTNNSRECSACLRTFSRVIIKTYVYNGKTVYAYKDQFNRAWRGRFCDDCWKANRFNKTGQSYSAISTFPPLKKGRESELIVAEEFRKMGFTVTIGTGKRADLFIEFLDKILTCEVKTASKNKRSWSCGAVHPKQKTNDLFSLVLKNGFIYTEQMSEHLKKCSPSGIRAVSSIVRKYGYTNPIRT